MNGKKTQTHTHNVRYVIVWEGWGGALRDYDSFFYSFFPVQQTTRGIGHRVKLFVRVGNQYAECKKQQPNVTTIGEPD